MFENRLEIGQPWMQYGPTTPLASATAGDRFWQAISQQAQATTVGPLRELEGWLADNLSQGNTPLVNKARDLAVRGELIRQFDDETCTYNAAANALRVLDQPRPEYTLSGLREAVRKAHGNYTEELSDEFLQRICQRESGWPFSQFRAYTSSAVVENEVGKSTRMYLSLQRLQEGTVGLTNFSMSPTPVRIGGNPIFHKRTVVGYTNCGRELIMHFIDPYEAQVSDWRFRDWMVAKAMDCGGPANLESLIGKSNEQNRFFLTSRAWMATDLTISLAPSGIRTLQQR